MKSHLKKTLGLLGALIVQKSFEEEEREFQLQEKERLLEEKNKQLREIEDKIAAAKAKWKTHVELIYKSQPLVATPVKEPYAGRKYILIPREKKSRESRPNKNLVITLKGDKASARVYRWANEHWRFVVCLPTRKFLVHRVFKDRKRCFAAAKMYIFSRAATQLPTATDLKSYIGAKMAGKYAADYSHVYQPLDTFYDYKAHEIEMRSQIGGDDFNFVYWYTKGVNDAMDDTCKWDIKFNRNLEL